MSFYPRSLVVLQLDVEGTDTDIDVCVVPLSVSWESAPKRVADQASVEILWENLPLDSRTLQGARLTVYAADVEHPNVELSITNTAAVRFVGFVDTIDNTHRDGSTVRLRARDYRGRLIDSRMPALKSVRVDRDLVDIMKDLAGQLAGYSAFGVEYGEGIPATKPSDHTGRKIHALRKNATIWQTMVEICASVGLMPNYVLDRLVIDDPEPATVARNRIFLYGRNLKSLDYRRDLNPQKDEAITLRAWGRDARRRVEVTFPASLPSEQTAGKKVKKVSSSRGFLIPGAYSPAQLKALAERIYRSTQRGQLTGSFDTKTMLDLDDQEILNLRSGNNVTIGVRSFENASVLGMTESELDAWLRQQGLDPKVAASLARGWSLRAFDNPERGITFFVKSARHMVEASQGYSLRVNFEAFIGTT